MIHSNLTERWQNMTLAEQLGNVASEVGRCFNYIKTENKERLNSSFDRALELLDLTIQNPKLTFPRRKELLRSREQFCLAVTENTSEKNLISLENYFFQFALLARKNK